MATNTSVDTARWRPARHADGVVPPRLATDRLVLVPVTAEIARAVVEGRLENLSAGPGWPHADTRDAMAMALTTGAGPLWLITLDGMVIGDFGTYAWPDADGVVEIGYGIGEPSRGHGYATEAGQAVCEWLIQGAGAKIIVAATEPGNAPSKRVLVKLGFEVTAEDGPRVQYQRVATAVA